MQLTVYRLDKESLLHSKKVMNLRDADKVHKILTKAVNCTRAEAKLLYRTKIMKDCTYLYVQAEKKIDEQIIEDYGFKVIYRIDIGTICSSLKSESIIKFSVVVWPMQQTPDGEKCINDLEERKEWLLGRLARGGIETETRFLIEKNHSITEFTKKRPDGSVKRTGIMGVEFEGVGKITDVQKFSDSIKNGFSRCKNYGMGLMLFQVAQ